MKHVMLWVLLLGASPAASGGLASELYGHWETDIANCDNPAPEAGRQVVIEAGAGSYVKFHYLDHETEGGTCILRPSPAGDVLSYSGQCRWEEGPESPQSLTSSVGADGALTLAPDWFVDQITFQRCPDNTPMDIEMGN